MVMPITEATADKDCRGRLGCGDVRLGFDYRGWREALLLPVVVQWISDCRPAVR
jgi:hypothetical protein